MIGQEDALYTYEYPGHFKILPSINDWSNDLERIGDGIKVESDFMYCSDTNEDWMGISEIQNWNIYPSKHYDLYFALKVMDFYSAILVVVTLCIFTAKVTDDKKGLPHIFLGTCTIFTMSWGKWNLEKELFIISLCVLTMLIILFYKREPINIFFFIFLPIQSEQYFFNCTVFGASKPTRQIKFFVFNFKNFLFIKIKYFLFISH